MLQFTYKLTY